MIIGNIPKRGEAGVLGRWIIGIELLRCPPGTIGIFRPYIFVVCMKIADWGEPGVYGGNSQKRVGGWKEWKSPIGIYFKITRF